MAARKHAMAPLTTSLPVPGHTPQGRRSASLHIRGLPDQLCGFAVNGAPLGGQIEEARKLKLKPNSAP